MESPRLKEESIIKDVRNLFRQEKLKKETIDATIKDIRKLFKLGKENKVIKDRIIKDIRNAFRLEEENKEIKDRIIRDISDLSEYEKEDYYQAANNFPSNNCIGYKTEGDRKTLSVEEYLNKIKPY